MKTRLITRCCDSKYCENVLCASLRGARILVEIYQLHKKMGADLFDIEKAGFQENMVAIKTNDGKKRSSDQ